MRRRPEARPPPANPRAPGANPGPSCVRSRGWPRRCSPRHVGQRRRLRVDLGEVAGRHLGAHAPRPRCGGHSGGLRCPRTKALGTRLVGVAPPPRSAPPAEVRELGAAGGAVARRCEARAEGHRRGRGCRLGGVSVHPSPHWRKPPKKGETRPRAHSREAQSAAIGPALWATPPSIDAHSQNLPTFTRRSSTTLPARSIRSRC